MNEEGQEKKRLSPKRRYPLCLLGRAAATATHGSASTTRWEVSTGCLAHTAPATGSTAATKASTVELARVGAPFFDLDLNAVDRVRVGSDCGLEASGCLEVDKGTVLKTMLMRAWFAWNCHSPCHG